MINTFLLFTLGDDERQCEALQMDQILSYVFRPPSCVFYILHTSMLISVRFHSLSGMFGSKPEGVGGGWGIGEQGDGVNYSHKNPICVRATEKSFAFSVL